MLKEKIYGKEEKEKTLMEVVAIKKPRFKTRTFLVVELILPAVDVIIQLYIKSSIGNRMINWSCYTSV